MSPNHPEAPDPTPLEEAVEFILDQARTIERKWEHLKGLTQVDARGPGMETLVDDLEKEISDLVAGLPEYQRQIETLKACLFQMQEAAKADAARLDWLGKHPRLSQIVVEGEITDCYFYGVAGAMGLKLREVIDAAMGAKQ